MSFVTRSTSQFRYLGKRFQFIGVNYYPFIVETSSTATMQQILGTAKSRGINVVRTWCFDAGNPPTNSAGNFRYRSGTSLLWREATLVQLDTVLDYARRYGIKMVLSLADNPTYLTKKTYVDWANAIYGTSLDNTYPYIAFFSDSGCIQLYKDFILGLVNRVNTINGITYKNDDTIMSWELGNELRTDAFEGGNVNSLNSENLILLSKAGGWIDTMSTYIKSIDTNHLVSFSACSHGYAYTTGDTVWNGTFYGVDYNIISALTNIDYMDCHLYPTQGGGELQILEYGQHLGYPDALTGDGLRDQIRDYVNVAKANNKPCVIGEVGFIREAVTASTTYFSLYPRHAAFKEIFDVFFGGDGDGVMLWSATYTGGGSYSVALNPWNDARTNANTNDSDLMNIISRRVFKGSRVPISCDG